MQIAEGAAGKAARIKTQMPGSLQPARAPACAAKVVARVKRGGEGTWADEMG